MTADEHSGGTRGDSVEILPTDVALTSGRCKRYANALRLQYGGGVFGDREFAECRERITVAVTATDGANVSFGGCDGNYGNTYANDTDDEHRAQRLICNRIEYGDGVQNVTLHGAPAAVNSALSTITFCPMCVGSLATITARIVGAGHCAFDGGAGGAVNFSVRAASAFVQRVRGKVRDGRVSCATSAAAATELNSVDSSDADGGCWRAAVENATVSVAIGGEGCVAASTSSDVAGRWELAIPYDLGHHRTAAATVAINAHGYFGAKQSVPLAVELADIAATAAARYAWVLPVSVTTSVDDDDDGAVEGFCQGNIVQHNRSIGARDRPSLPAAVNTEP